VAGRVEIGAEFSGAESDLLSGVPPAILLPSNLQLFWSVGISDSPLTVTILLLSLTIFFIFEVLSLLLLMLSLLLPSLHYF